MTSDAILREYHAAYVSATGLEVILSMDRLFAWEAFRCHRDTHPFTCQDIADVVQFIRSWEGPEIVAACLSFRKLIGDPGFFEDVLLQIESKRLQKARKAFLNSDRNKALRATGRAAETPQPDAVPVGEVVEKLDVTRHLNEWRRQQGMRER